MSRSPLGTLMFVRRVVEDFPGAFAFEELRRSGAEIVVEAQEHTEWNTRFAQARDPSGALVELSGARGGWGSLTAAP